MTSIPYLGDVPPNSVPWIPNRAARVHYGPGVFYIFLPGEKMRCVQCSGVLGENGDRRAVAIRVHPGGRNASPTTADGESRTCQGCRTHLDIVQLRVLRVMGEDRHGQG